MGGFKGECVCVYGAVGVFVCMCGVEKKKKSVCWGEMQDASSDSVPRGQTHTHAGKKTGLRRGKQEQAVRSHQSHHTLDYADLGAYCKLIRKPGVTGGRWA